MSDFNIENQFKKQYETLKKLLEVTVENEESFAILNGELMAIEELQQAVYAFETLSNGVCLQDALKLLFSIDVLELVIRPVVFNGVLAECLCIKTNKGGVETESPLLMGVNSEIFKLITPI